MALRFDRQQQPTSRDLSASPLRVAFVGHRAMPSNYGGVEIYAEAVGKRLAKRGVYLMSFAATPVSKASHPRRKRQTPRPLHEGIQLHTTGRIEGKHLGALSQAFLATLQACRSNADVVHFMALGPVVFSPIVRLLSRRTAIVVTVAGRDDQRKKWGWLARQLLRVSMAVCMRVPDQIIAVSEALAQDLRTTSKRPVVAIANGVSVPEGAANAPALPDVVTGRFVLYAGRLVPEKRAEDLIHAFANVEGDFQLIIAGGAVRPGPYVEMLHVLAAKDSRVHLVGHRSVEEIDALMRSATAFVLPSELEGMPIALLEALGRGVPVVVSDLPCHLEVITQQGPGAQIVGIGDVSNLTKAISSVLHHPEKASVDAAERQITIRATHDWDVVTDAVEHVYHLAVEKETLQS